MVRGTQPTSVTVDPSGRYVYVSSETADNVSIYRIGTSGNLIGGLAPVDTGNTPRFVIADPGGKYVYVANFGDNTFSQYAIGDSGGLAPIAPAEVATRPGPSAIAMTGGTVAVKAAPKFAYVANENTNNVSAYGIDATTGALSPVAGSPFSAGDGPHSVAVDPTGMYAYVANFNSIGPVGVSKYAINAVTGVLGSREDFDAGTNPRAVAVDPSGRYVYVANFSSGNVSGYTINATTGVLTPIAGSPFGAAAGSISVAVDPTGQYVYVVNENFNSISQYTINTTNGVLTPMMPAAVSTASVGTAPSYITVDPTGRYAYVTTFGFDNILRYAIGTDGTLSDPQAVVPGTTDPASIVIDPTGQYAYVGHSGSNNIGRYLVGSNGELTSGAGFSTNLSQPGVRYRRSER